MEVEKFGTKSSNRTPIKQYNSSQNNNIPFPILIQDSPVLEKQKVRKSVNQNEMRQNMIDEQIDSNTITLQKQEKNLDNKLFSSNQQFQFIDFNKHIENLKLYASNHEKENMICQSMTESNKQITNRNNQRDSHLIDIISQQKQNDLSIFVIKTIHYTFKQIHITINKQKDNQSDEFRLKLKQRDMQLQSKDDENRELNCQLKMMEQKLHNMEQEYIELKQTNKKYQQVVDEQKSIFEKKIVSQNQNPFIQIKNIYFSNQQKIQSNQDYTSEINSEWKTQMYEQKSLVEDLQRKVFNLESKSERITQENQQITEKNMELYNQNSDLKEELDKQKRDYQLLKAQTRQEEGIFDEYGNQQNKFISQLISYQKDLKDVFDQINSNPIIEKYKKQNDELLIENTNVKIIIFNQIQLREQVIKLNQEISERQLEDIKRNSQEQDRLNEFDVNSNSNALVLYENMMQKFTEMDERMVQNDNEKFEALQQKDFWFNKQQQFEKENQDLKEKMKLLLSKNEEYESQFNQKNTKKGANAIATNHKTKKRKAGKDSDIEDENIVIVDKKIKPNIEQIDISPQKNVFDTRSTNIQSNFSNHIQPSIQQLESLNVPTQTKSNTVQSIAPSLPVKNTSLFQLKVCIKCNLNIKKMQEYETCTQCRKDYHSKCKGESVIGAFCSGCYEKNKKKANNEMEEEKKPKEPNQQNDMIPEN